ncbi:hypothetical protein [Sanyastnella coralliicola]|uniref:hypothetical protein n=1 Tax=Sanyastnella coralliicola TaxID=3069118 RepID=UPI0027B92F2D|nr:hypothetical protein [Longitalea sp. SCSIO 12813]
MKYWLSFVLFFFALTAEAQYDCDSTVFISGKVTAENGRPMFDAMVVNRTRSVGQFCEPDGSYLIKACKGDTIQFAATGYISVRISFADSTWRPQYTANIQMKQLRISIPEVEVIAPRELQAIHDDIQTLGFNEKDYRVSEINAIQSPITFLYQAFSKRERSRREAIELRNNDRRRELLKELFGKYAEYDIIDLEDDEFDAFIDFMDPGDERLKRFSQYEFILYVKDRFAAYEKYGRSRSLDPSDHQYHLDDD